MDNGLYFSCQIGALPEQTFAVAEFQLDEALSDLFTLTLSLVSEQREIDLDAQLLQSATLTVTVNGQEQRTVHGVVTSAVRGDSGFRRTYYTLVVRPRLWILTLNQDSRIYHQQTVPDILKALLQQHRILADYKWYDAHQKREYVTQKRESAYDFFCRLAAEEGITFWFEHDRLFYCDNHLGMLVSARPVYNPHVQPAVAGDFISQLSFGSYMRPQETRHKDRTYHQPDYRLQHKAETKGKWGQNSPYSVFESYGRFQKDNVAKPFTQYRLEALQADSRRGTAKSNCIKLTPGKVFILAEHPVGSMNDRWQVVSVSHHGKMPAALEEESDNSHGTTLTNELSFIPGRQEWRPPYRYKPLADGDEIATVVGPANEEIYVNKDGAIKVHFHWNRYDEADDKASCWVRVAQGWNGGGYGFLATPRIGQEVIISYLNGDIDRPIVTGTTYNDLNKPPLNLPAEKTRTTFKTKTHKGDGFNELSFDDDKGHEEIFIHAQRDMNSQTINDQNNRIDHNRTSTIGNNEYLSVNNDRMVVVQGNQNHKTIGNYLEKVSGDKSLFIEGDLVQKIEGELGINVSGNLVLQSDRKITFRVGNNFIVIDSQGVDIQGLPTLNLNSGGNPEKVLTHLLDNFSTHYVVKDENGDPIRNRPYSLTTASGKKILGLTDNEGKTEVLWSDIAEEVYLSLEPQSKITIA